MVDDIIFERWWFVNVQNGKGFLALDEALKSYGLLEDYNKVCKMVDAEHYYARPQPDLYAVKRFMSVNCIILACDQKHPLKKKKKIRHMYAIIQSTVSINYVSTCNLSATLF